GAGPTAASPATPPSPVASEPEPSTAMPTPPLPIAAVLLAATAAALADPADHPGPLPIPARYALSLTPNAFSVLPAAAQSRVSKYGGQADFQLQIARPDAADAPAWKITVTNPRLMEGWHVWMAEKSAELLAAIDPDHIDEPARLALATVKSANAKLDAARA